ncbi:MAG TPA: hypothetical protein VGB23_09410, partial [Nitrospirota bacterium]
MDEDLIRDVKLNCDISDAKYWGYFSVCGLLMRYRDLFRSEMGLKPWSEISRTEIAAWIEQKEARWPELEQQELSGLVIDGNSFHPFDVTGINQALEGRGLVYGAGYGMYLKPTFFVAELRSRREVSGLTVYTTAKELVRDLFTSPAMLQEKTVYLRLEPLTVLLLYKHSELNARGASIIEDAFTQYGLSHRQIMDATFERRMEETALRYAEILLAHELAEDAEEVPEWKDILSLVAGDRLLEHYLRAVKDLVADTSGHGPLRKIIESRDRGALGLSIALAEGHRRVLYPELNNAYRELTLNGDWKPVEQARKAGYERFRSKRDELVDRFRQSGASEDFIAAVKE